MTGFDEKMMDMYFGFNALVLALNVIAFLIISRAIGRGTIRNVFAVAFSFIAYLFAASLSMIIAGLVFVPDFSTAAAQNLAGVISWSIEAGIEYGLLAIGAGLLLHIGYLIARSRSARVTG